MRKAPTISDATTLDRTESPLTRLRVSGNVELGSRVIAAGLGRGAEAVPRIVWEQAGGAEGVAKLILRKLDLDEEADERSVLGPALAAFEESAVARSAAR